MQTCAEGPDLQRNLAVRRQGVRCVEQEGPVVRPDLRLTAPVAGNHHTPENMSGGELRQLRGWPVDGSGNRARAAHRG